MQAEHFGTASSGDCVPGPTPRIPQDINDLGLMAAAEFYFRDLGWAVHPLAGPDRGAEQDRGKRPLLKGWRGHVAAEVTPRFLERHFGPDSSNNLGCVVRAPYVHIDLDSKADAGTSVQRWLASQPQLASVPRERTGGGAHLVFRCLDVPEAVLKSKKAPTARINEAVTAELYLDGLNIVLSPSVHKSGHTYAWEVTGEIPEVGWADLSRWFGFAAPEPKKRGRPPKERPWWSEWEGDLKTLDLKAALEALGMLGECLDPGESKWAVRCPWGHEHTGGAPEAPGSDTVVFLGPGRIHAFHCLHAHCAGRTIRHLLQWMDSQRSGIVDEHCAQRRVWSPGSETPQGRPKIVLPGTGRTFTEFATELGEAVARARGMFFFKNSVVEIVEVDAAGRNKVLPGFRIDAVSPPVLVTAVERTAETGVLQRDEAGDTVFLPKSMTEQDARIVLCSRAFTTQLPPIERVLEAPLPFLDAAGGLVYPEPGYDPRFRTWLSPDAPKLRPMDLEEARSLLFGELLAPPGEGGFWWHDEQARLHALARLITPFCRGLVGWMRVPVWIYDGNREGCGKDTCADVAHVLYTGRSVVCAPLSKDCDAEMRKRITSALMAGARFFHLANMKDHVRYDALEAATDSSGVWEDRKLGASEILVLPNEMEFSFSANNTTWEPDIERRCRIIRLRFTPEDVNTHRYRHPNLREWIRDRRGDLLSAINALVVNWVRQGCPPGPTPFTSFPEWSRVVGGILHSCGFGDPCLPHGDSQVSGDRETRAMRGLFELAYVRFGNKRIPKAEFNEFIKGDESVNELFDWIDFRSHSGPIAFGKLMNRFDGRELQQIRLTVDRSSKNWAFYQFAKLNSEIPSLHPANPPFDANGVGSVGSVGKEDHGVAGREKCTAISEQARAFIQPCSGSGEPSHISHVSHSIPPLNTCRSMGDLARVVDDLVLSGTGRIALALEICRSTEGGAVDPWDGDIRLLSLCREGGPVWMLDLRSIGYDLGALATILETATLVAHGAKSDLLWLRVKCGLRSAKVFCTLTAACLLSAGTRPDNKLAPCLERYLGIEPGKDQSRSDWGSMLLTDDQIARAARDVARLHDLAKALETGIGGAALKRVWALESALLPRVVEMEAAGILVDSDRLKSIAAKANAAAGRACAELREALGNPTLNPASPDQLLAALQAKGIALDSTSAEALEVVADHQIRRLIRDYRRASCRASTAEGLVTHVKSDGRIHARFEPTATATGRFSSKKPNLQSIERGELREAFVPAPGHRFIVADYSQVELRAAAAIAGETRMIEAYRTGADLHRLTASIVLGKPEDEVTKDDRQTAKSSNFGLIYGQSAPRLVRNAASSYGVHLDADQAKEIHAAFFRTYGQLRQWHELSHQKAEQGVVEVRTRLGRRRLVPATADEWKRFTALVNTPVQGGCADGMKRAIVLLAQRLPEGSRLVSTVHDEVIVETPEAGSEEIAALVAATMREAMEELFPEVPIEVEARVCGHWGEKR